MPIKITTDDFIKNASIIHNKKYSYSKVNYNKSSEKVIITCNLHGDFNQTPNKHLQGKGCPKCGFISRCKLASSNTDEFINKAILKHGDKYNYTDVNYKGRGTKVSIICKFHGIFNQTPHNHLAGNGCPTCRNSQGENKVKLFLERYNIDYETQKRFENCRHKLPLPFDFYIPLTNICIEYQGIQHFEPRSKFGGQVEFEKTLMRDSIKAKYCKDNNINLIIIPYNVDVIDTLSVIFKSDVFLT